MRKNSFLKIFLFTLFLSCSYQVLLYSQIENIPAGHPVYLFLKKMQVQGVINDYNDVIIPLSRKKIIELLSEVEIYQKSIWNFCCG